MTSEQMNITINSDPFSISQPGASRDNFFLKGLGYQIVVKNVHNIENILLYSSDVFGDEDHVFEFTKISATTWNFNEKAGIDGGATGREVISALDDVSNYLLIEKAWDFGICFNFRIKIIGQGYPYNLGVKDIFFWVRDPQDFITINNLNYQRQDNGIYYPILFNTLTLPVNFGLNAKTDQGVKLFGGAETVSISNTTGYLNMIVSIPETSISEVNQIVFLNRDEAPKIPNFILPPGYPDFSNYYYFITLRFRGKQASSYYKDIPIILFAAGKCVGQGTVEGYDSSGDKLPKPTGEEFEIDSPGIPEYPPPECSSNTDIGVTSGNFNVYASLTKVYIYDAPTGGNLIAQGEATVTDENTINIRRVDLEVFAGPLSLKTFKTLTTTTDQPVQGYVSVVQYGPERESENRTEIVVYGCKETPITTITTDDPEEPTQIVTITTGGGRLVDEDKEYEIVFRPDKYSETGEERFTATVKDEDELTFVITDDLTGWLKIIEDGIEITKWIEVVIKKHEAPADITYVLENLGTYHSIQVPGWELIKTHCKVYFATGETIEDYGLFFYTGYPQVWKMLPPFAEVHRYTVMFADSLGNLININSNPSLPPITLIAGNHPGEVGWIELIEYFF